MKKEISIQEKWKTEKFWDIHPDLEHSHAINHLLNHGLPQGRITVQLVKFKGFIAIDFWGGLKPIGVTGPTDTMYWNSNNLVDKVFDLSDEEVLREIFTEDIFDRVLQTDVGLSVVRLSTDGGRYITSTYREVPGIN